MKKDIKTLRQYATLKKLPSVIKLGIIDQKINEQLLDLCMASNTTTERSIQNRKGIYGVEHNDSSPAGKTYNQKHIDKWAIDIDCLSIFQNKSDWRFAELEPNAVIPMHLDDPYTYRFLAVLQGSHTFKDLNKEQVMSASEVYFINPAYKHSVENTGKERRIALLGKIEINEHNTELLRARA